MPDTSVDIGDELMMDIIINHVMNS